MAMVVVCFSALRFLSYMYGSEVGLSTVSFPVLTSRKPVLVSIRGCAARTCLGFTLTCLLSIGMILGHGEKIGA